MPQKDRVTTSAALSAGMPAAKVARLAPLALALLALAGTAQAASDKTNPLADTSWIAEDIGGLAAAAEVQSTIVFSANGEAAGSAGCNRFRTLYGVEAGELKFTPIMTTRKLCPEAVMKQEKAFVLQLGRVGSFYIKDGKLYLGDSEGADLVRLSAKK